MTQENKPDALSQPKANQSIDVFIAKWAASGAAERANKDFFLIELCDLLDVPRPNPTTGDPDQDVYVFEADARTPHEGGTVSIGKADLYKEGCFILEAKQGSEAGSKKVGTAKRGTPTWTVSMKDAYGQALGYARSFDTPPPFLLVCDIGYCFDVYAVFDGTGDYRPFPNAQNSRLFHKDLANHVGSLRSIFLDPHSLDPSRNAVRVTREVAKHLAELARTLEEQHSSEDVATFLMRCLFTMFAEDVGLLPPETFTKAIEQHWLPNPPSFAHGVQTFWRAMNDGDYLFTGAKLLQFNGGLFANTTALPLDRDQLQLLLDAAKCDWADVEPAIFGTLIERALDKKERHQLGAHFTPRAYVERLVRPTIEEPLRADWDIVQAQVRQLIAADAAADPNSKVGKKALKQAIKAVRDFHQKLSDTRVLDPACGSGNFLYVALDLFKRLESEILALLAELGETQTLLDMESVRVTPAQFLGIEIKRWAKEIADLVLWIGYIQWHFRTHGTRLPVPEPVLRDYHNIECRDAILAYDSQELVRDDTGKPVTRWDGESTKKHPVTGEDVPDESKQIPVYQYTNPRPAEWPDTDFVVGNPPFIGNWRMRSALGDGYTETLRKTLPGVPETVDYVMYWWDKAAHLTRAGKLRRFGLITTNSITQSFARRVVRPHLEAKNGLSLVFAIPDHPWVDSASGADVRIAMTVSQLGEYQGQLNQIAAERKGDQEAVQVSFNSQTGKLNSDLTAGANVASAVPLRANHSLSCPGVKLHGSGFIVTPGDAANMGLGRVEGIERVIREYRNGRDLTQTPRGVFVIDLFGMDIDRVRDEYPEVYQWVFDRVKPERDQNKRATYRDNWWIFGEPRAKFRPAVEGLDRYVATVETSKHRFFVFLEQSVLPDNMLVNIALDDAFYLGVLSSCIHVTWALAAGGTLEDRPRYNKTRCFDPFPFPVCPEELRLRIQDLAESLDAHRKRQQELHAGLTMTGMYNVLTKLRTGETLTAKEKVIHEHGLVSVLKQLHDDLDAAVFEAYGWPTDLTDEQILERLVDLNAERAEEERNGHIRWLRPEYQNPAGTKAPSQVAMGSSSGTDPEASPAATALPSAKPWPKKLPDQIAAVRDLIASTGGSSWTTDQVATAFKGAGPKSVEPVLESLAALGLIVAYDAKGSAVWKSSGTAA